MTIFSVWVFKKKNCCCYKNNRMNKGIKITEHLNHTNCCNWMRENFVCRDVVKSFEQIFSFLCEKERSVPARYRWTKCRFPIPFIQLTECDETTNRMLIDSLLFASISRNFSPTSDSAVINGLILSEEWTFSRVIEQLMRNKWSTR